MKHISIMRYDKGLRKEATKQSKSLYQRLSLIYRSTLSDITDVTIGKAQNILRVCFGISKQFYY